MRVLLVPSPTLSHLFSFKVLTTDGSFNNVVKLMPFMFLSPLLYKRRGLTGV